MKEKIILAVRLITRKFPFLYRLLGHIYHAIQFYVEDVKLRNKYPKVKHIKINNRNIIQQQNDGFQSQYGQETFLLDNNYIPDKAGRFVDVGCNHPIQCSNTFALEKKHGYTGLAIDPLTKFIDFWKEERPNSTFVNKFLSSSKNKVEFVEVSGNAGWEHMLSGEVNSINLNGKDVKGEIRVIETSPLQDILDENSYDTNIDVMFIDVEGHELDVIEGVDWSRTKPKVIVIENFGGFEKCNVLRSKLMNVGYNFIARIGISDDVFIYSNK